MYKKTGSYKEVVKMTKKIETQIWNALKTITDIKEAWNIIDRFNLSNTETNKILNSWKIKQQILRRA